MTSGLPSGWEAASLNVVCEVNPARRMVDATQDALFNFVGMAAVRKEFGGVDVSAMRSLHEVQKGYTQFAEADVLFAKITPCMENGKVAVVPALNSDVGYGSTEFHVLRPLGTIEPKWIGHFVSMKRFRREAQRNMSGSAGQLRVPKHWLEEQVLPLAPLEEQRRIVATIEELLSNLDAGVAALERVRIALKRYRASVLKAAVEGRLTEQWREENPDVEPADELLRRILDERRRRWERERLAKYEAKGQKPPTGWREKYEEPPHEDGLFDLPAGWVWASALEVCDSVENGNTPPADDMTPGTGEIPYIKVYNLTRDGTLDFSVKPTFIPYSTHEGLLRRSRLTPGDVLMNIVGPPLGKVSVVPSDYPEWNTNQAVVAFRPSVAIKSRYLTYALLADEVLEWIVRTARATAGQFNVSVSNSRRLPIPLPPVEEQTAIEDILDEHLSAAGRIDGSVQGLQRRASSMRQSILQYAFEGKLVPQDPSDEPASVLLGRIRAERTAVQAASPKRPRKPRAPRTDKGYALIPLPLDEME